MKTLVIGLFGLTLCTSISISHASENALNEILGQAILKSKVDGMDCDKVLDDAASKGVAPSSTASVESLSKAVKIYSVSTEVGQCLYPNVMVTRQPIGEYEEYKSGGPELVTLTGRIVYKWGKYEVQEAIVTTPEHLDIEVIPNGTGYRISLATKAK